MPAGEALRPDELVYSKVIPIGEARRQGRPATHDGECVTLFWRPVGPRGYPEWILEDNSGVAATHDRAYLETCLDGTPDLAGEELQEARDISEEIESTVFSPGDQEASWGDLGAAAQNVARSLDWPIVENYLGVAEVAELLDWSKSRVSEYLKREKLPKPAFRIAAGPVWRKEDIENFASEAEIAEIAKAVGEANKMRYIGPANLAQTINWSHQQVIDALGEGKLPKPALMVSGRPVWLLKDVEPFAVAQIRWQHGPDCKCDVCRLGELAHWF